MPAPEGWETDPSDPNVIRKIEDTRNLPEGITPPWENGGLWTYGGLSSEEDAKRRWIEYQRAKAQAAALQKRLEELQALQKQLFESGADTDWELSAKASAIREQINSIVQQVSDLNDIVMSYEVGNYGQAGDENAPEKFEISLPDYKIQGMMERTALWIPEFTKADGSLDLEGAIEAGHEGDIIKLYGQNYVDVIKAQNAEKAKIADMKAKGILNENGQWADDWYNKAMAAGYTPEDLYKYGITPNDIFNAQFFNTVKEKYTLENGQLDYAKMHKDGISLSQLELLGVTIDGEPITQKQYDEIAKELEIEPQTLEPATQTEFELAAEKQNFLNTHTLIPDPTGEALDVMGEPIYMSNDTLENLKKEQPDLYNILMTEGYIAYKNKLDALRLDYEHQQVLMDKLAPYEVVTEHHRIGGEQTDIDTQGTITTTTSFDLEKAIRDIRAGKAEITLNDLKELYKDNPEVVTNTEAYIDATDKLEPYEGDIVDYLRKNDYDTQTLLAAGYRQANVDKALEMAKKTPDYFDYMQHELEGKVSYDYDNINYTKIDQNSPQLLQDFRDYKVLGKLTPELKKELENYNANKDRITKEYNDKYGESQYWSSVAAKPLSFVFAPARALRPDIGIKDIQKSEWVLGAGQALAIAAIPFSGAMGSAGAWMSRGIQLGSAAAFSAYTAMEWDNMSKTERAMSLVLDITFGALAVGEPFVKWVKSTPLGEDMRAASNKVKEATKRLMQEERGSIGWNYDPLTGERQLSPYRKAGTTREFATSADELMEAIQSGNLDDIERALKKTGQKTIDDALKDLDEQMTRMEKLDAVKGKYEKQQRQSALYEGTKNGQIDEARRLGVEDAVRKIHANEYLSQRQKVVTAREFLEKVDKAVKEAWLQEQKVVTYKKWLETQKPIKMPVVAPSEGVGSHRYGQLVWDTPYILTTPGLAPVPTPSVVGAPNPATVVSPSPMTQPDREQKPLPMISPLTKIDTQTRTDTKTETKTETQGETKVETKLYPDVQIFPDTQTQTQTKTLAETEEKTKTETKTKIDTDVRTRLYPRYGEWTRTTPSEYEAVKPDTGTPKPPETDITEPPPYSPKKGKSKYGRDGGSDEDKEEKRRQFTGAVAWKQGFGWWAIKKPFRGREDMAFFYGEPPPGAKTVEGGAGAAYRSIQAMGGEVPENLAIDMGIMNIKITKPESPGKPGAIEYAADAEVVASSKGLDIEPEPPPPVEGTHEITIQGEENQEEIVEEPPPEEEIVDLTPDRRPYHQTLTEAAFTTSQPVRTLSSRQVLVKNKPKAYGKRYYLGRELPDYGVKVDL